MRNPGSNKERERDYRRAIEDLREQKRLQAELSAYDLDADGDDDL
nr:hypothetical protein [Aliidiomarina quisquiliarum]